MSLEVYHSPAAIPLNRRGGCWLIGNFDGVHVGHRTIIAQLQAEFADLGLITFEPHPQQFFAPQQPFMRLTPAAQRQQLLHDIGVRRLLVLNFDAELATMSASDFISQILQQACGAQVVAVGEGFRFGHKRQGDVALLKSTMGDAAVRVMAPVCDTQGLPYSSTRVRAALAAGDAALAQRLLGWSVAANKAI